MIALMIKLYRLCMMSYETKTSYEFLKTLIRCLQKCWLKLRNTYMRKRFLRKMLEDVNDLLKP